VDEVLDEELLEGIQGEGNVHRVVFDHQDDCLRIIQQVFLSAAKLQ
jgi:hypothetical protein